MNLIDESKQSEGHISGDNFMTIISMYTFINRK